MVAERSPFGKGQPRILEGVPGVSRDVDFRTGSSPADRAGDFRTAEASEHFGALKPVASQSILLLGQQTRSTRSALLLLFGGPLLK